MKTNLCAALSATVMTVSLLVLPHAIADSTNPSIPVGSLVAFPTVVQTGTKPTLTWSITYPSKVEDVVTITPTTTTTGGSSSTSSTVTPKVNLIADIRVLGAGVTTQDSQGHIVYIRTVGQIRYNGATSWTTIFDGKNTDTIVQQQSIIKTINVTANQSMYFAGKYYYNNAWGPFYTSISGDNVRTLLNGSACPTNMPDYNAPSLESFIKPYLDASKKVKIGPMDMIVFMELTHTDKSNVGYDVQDLVFLVTFRTS
jgi:hypothetical protein